MAKTRLNGIEIDYEVTGRGRPVLMSHGYSATRRMWSGQHEFLGDRYRLISWDMRGHGQTESPNDPAQYSHARTVADMKALLDHLGVQRAVIGGLSLGGTMSLGLGSRVSQRGGARDVEPACARPRRRARAARARGAGPGQS